MRRQCGFSLIELLIVVVMILVITVIAVPNLLRARIAANEGAAVSALRSISTAQISYKISYPQIGYAATLDKLGPSATPSSDQAGLLAADIAVSPFQKSGYTFSTLGTASDFTANAVPISTGTTGTRTFCTDTPAVIFQAPPGETCDPRSSKQIQ